ncbi:MAG TPA: hypothetical protein ENO21_04845 [Firmicutes bacterium]|nr:hypothetical protein [Bacillota bacterium]
MRLKELGFDAIGVGKIRDIFNGRGLTASQPLHGNQNLLAAVSNLSREVTWRGLVFCNLVDFDMLYGHRNNVSGYAEELLRFDEWLGEFLKTMGDEELLILTADHGNDPTTQSTDHSREQVPVLITSNGIAGRGGNLVTPEPGLYHVGKTVLRALGVDGDFPGLDLLAL